MQTLRQILYFIIPTMILYWLLRAQIVRLILGSGQFGWEDTRFTVSVLAFFTLGMVAHATIPLLARSFYALQDTKTPFITSLVALVTNVVLALILIKYLNVVGLALAISISAILNAGILLWILDVKLGGLVNRSLIKMVSKVIGSSLIMGIVGYGALQASSWIVNTHTFLGLLVQTLITTIIALLTYLAITRHLHIKEVKMILKPLKLLIKK